MRPLHPYLRFGTWDFSERFFKFQHPEIDPRNKGVVVSISTRFIYNIYICYRFNDLPFYCFELLYPRPTVNQKLSLLPVLITDLYPTHITYKLISTLNYTEHTDTPVLPRMIIKRQIRIKYLHSEYVLVRGDLMKDSFVLKNVIKNQDEEVLKDIITKKMEIIINDIFKHQEIKTYSEKTAWLLNKQYGIIKVSYINYTILLSTKGWLIWV